MSLKRFSEFESSKLNESKELALKQVFTKNFLETLYRYFSSTAQSIDRITDIDGLVTPKIIQIDCEYVDTNNKMKVDTIKISWGDIANFMREN